MQTTNTTLRTVVTANVMTTLNTEQLSRAVDELLEAMKTPDPDNPGLWSTNIDERQVWGILDEGAGPGGENLLTILFPEDY